MNADNVVFVSACQYGFAGVRRQSKTEIKESLYLWLYGLHQKAPFQSNIVILFLNKTLQQNRSNKNLLQCVQEFSITVNGWLMC
jgi:hypothetical protein